MIPFFSGLGAIILIPLFHFSWRLLLQPWHDLQADIEVIRSQLETRPTESDPPKKKINRRLSVVNAIRKGKTIRDSPASYAHWSNSTEVWIDEVTHLLAEHVSTEATERFLTATDSK